MSDKTIPDGEGFWFVFEARRSKYIEICEFHRNKKGKAKDQQDGGIYFFHSPNQP